nr:hypothetical protein [Mycoplasmopsis bovis]
MAHLILTPPRKDPDHKDSFNENEQEIVPTKFTYNGKTYTINREDMIKILKMKV